MFIYLNLSYTCFEVSAMNALDMALYKINIIIIILFGYFEVLWLFLMLHYSVLGACTDCCWCFPRIGLLHPKAMLPSTASESVHSPWMHTWMRRTTPLCRPWCTSWTHRWPQNHAAPPRSCLQSQYSTSMTTRMSFSRNTETWLCVHAGVTRWRSGRAGIRISLWYYVVVSTARTVEYHLWWPHNGYMRVQGVFVVVEFYMQNRRLLQQRLN